MLLYTMFISKSLFCGWSKSFEHKTNCVVFRSSLTWLPTKTLLLKFPLVVQQSGEPIPLKHPNYENEHLIFWFVSRNVCMHLKFVDGGCQKMRITLVWEFYVVQTMISIEYKETEIYAFCLSLPSNLIYMRIREYTTHIFEVSFAVAW